MLNAIYFYRIGHWFYKKRIPVLPKIIELLIFLIYNSKVPSSAQIGKKTILAYGGIGCVIHHNTIIGSNVIIGTNVTIGGKSGHNNVPVIGDNVYISTGAKVLGPITVGSNAIIGANSVVVKDVIANTTVVGIPAKLLKHN